jgi:glycosyltransferase involved in cell wall biosynthesis
MADSLSISVIICAHNPHGGRLARTLDGLATQTLAKDQWELIVIDNASATQLANEWDLGWHPNARHVREDEVGKTFALLRGFAEARGEFLVIVDDDNVLSASYLEEICSIRRRMPFVEVLGAGHIAGEFEARPEPWMEPYLSLLALRDVSRDIWSNDPLNAAIYPCGAGMGISRSLGLRYASMVKEDRWREALGRKATSRASGEDCDICFMAGSLGLGVGVFRSLSLTHLIPSKRLTEDYLLAVSEGIAFSGCLLDYFWRNKKPPKHTLLWRYRFWRRWRGASAIARRFAQGYARAERRAGEIVASIEQGTAARTKP